MSLFENGTDEEKTRQRGVFFEDFIVLTVCIISVHFRYIYSTNLICGQGVVRFLFFVCKSSREICIFTKLPWLGRLIVEAEVRTSFS